MIGGFAGRNLAANGVDQPQLDGAAKRPKLQGHQFIAGMAELADAPG